MAPAFALALSLAAPAQAEAPLSAIDWLSQSVLMPAAVAPPGEPRTGLGPGGAPLSEGIALGEISVVPIDAPTPDAVGLLPAERAGLPRDFWGHGPGDRLAAEVRALDTDTLPALRELVLTLLLTEFDPPGDASARGALFLARIDKLLDFGALDQALALIGEVGTESPELFRRWFDIALLLGREDDACAALLARTELEPSYPARIYCFARTGDWNAAAVTLRSAEALAFISPEEEEVLARFLDPELFEGAPAAQVLERPTPLMWRMQEAGGDAAPTRTLPLAFAHADLRGTAGWRAQIEAAERLSRAGALTANRLLGLYTERRPAASGGVWDRVEAIQRLDAALTLGAPDAVAAALPAAWRHMAEAELESVLAELYAERLLRLTLDGPAAALAFRLGLLTADFAQVAERRKPADAQEAFLKALALDRPTDAAPVPGGALAEAIRDGLDGTVPEGPASRLLQDGRPGDAVLAAIGRLGDGAAGDLRALSEGLAVLRAAGLEDFARRTALQMLLLDRRG
jgi:hypothetical protein